MGGWKKIEIDPGDLRNLSIREIMEKYGCSDSTVSIRRRELGIEPVKATCPRKSIPADLVAKWVRLYTEEKLTLKAIKERFPAYGTQRIGEEIRNALGQNLETSRSHGNGWCAT